MCRECGPVNRLKNRIAVDGHNLAPHGRRKVEYVAAQQVPALKRSAACIRRVRGDHHVVAALHAVNFFLIRNRKHCAASDVLKQSAAVCRIVLDLDSQRIRCDYRSLVGSGNRHTVTGRCICSRILCRAGRLCHHRIASRRIETREDHATTGRAHKARCNRVARIVHERVLAVCLRRVHRNRSRVACRIRNRREIGLRRRNNRERLRSLLICRNQSDVASDCRGLIGRELIDMIGLTRLETGEVARCQRRAGHDRKHVSVHIGDRIVARRIRRVDLNLSRAVHSAHGGIHIRRREDHVVQRCLQNKLCGVLRIALHRQAAETRIGRNERATAVPAIKLIICRRCHHRRQGAERCVLQHGLGRRAGNAAVRPADKAHRAPGIRVLFEDMDILEFIAGGKCQRIRRLNLDAAGRRCISARVRRVPTVTDIAGVRGRRNAVKRKELCQRVVLRHCPLLNNDAAERTAARCCVVHLCKGFRNR